MNSNLNNNKDLFDSKKDFSLYNDLLIPIITISKNNELNKVLPGQIICSLKINEIKNIYFRLPKISNNNINFTNGINFEIFIEYIGDKISFKNQLKKNKKIKDFYNKFISNKSD